MLKVCQSIVTTLVIMACMSAMLWLTPLVNADMFSSSYSITSSSINAGGTDFSTSNGYSLHDTVGELATGFSDSSNYQIYSGYRQVTGSSISISIEPDVNLPTLGGVSGGESTATSTWTVTTDSPGGYEFSIRASTDPALQSPENNFLDYQPQAGSGNPDFSFQISDSDSVFGFSPEGDDITSTYKDDGSNCATGSGDSLGACWVGFPTTLSIVSQSSSRTPPNGTDTTIRYRAEIGPDKIQPEGTYQAEITVTAVSL